MHVACLELCKELYELSGWSEIGKYWFQGSDIGNVMSDPPIDNSSIWLVGIAGDYPAYDLGYLLRKLPATIDEGTQIGYLRLEKSNHGYAFCYMHGDLIPTYHTPADTPEDAACKLSIALFKEGILNRE